MPWTNIAHLARTQSNELLNTLQAGFTYIENESFQSTFAGLFSEINLGSDKLGKTYADRNAKLCTIITRIAEGLAAFSTDSDTLGDAYEYLLGQFAAGSGKKAGEFYTPQKISSILSGIVTLDSQEPGTGKRDRLDSVYDFACGSGSLLLNVRNRMGPHGIGKIYGQENNVTTYIGLPANLFYSTGIPVCILVLKKCKKPDDVLIINAERHFEKGKRQNYLSEDHIAEIVDTYQHRKEEDRYSKRVSMEEIAKNDYNLNISRYVSTAEQEQEIDLEAKHSELVGIEKTIRDARTKHNEFLKELGLPPLP